MNVETRGPSYRKSGRPPILFLLMALLVLLGRFDSPSAGAQTVDPVGVGAMVDLEQLPVFRTHTEARQVSSHDPTGGNDDGFFSVNFLYHDAARQEYVLAEESGAGCIYRIQMADLQSFSGPPVRLRIYLDGSSTPQVDMTIEDFFSGTRAPFLAPLVGASHPGVHTSFGFYAYVPIPYRTGMRIALTSLVHFYNISFHRYRDGIGSVPAFGQDRNVQEAVALWNQAGSRPTPLRVNEVAARTTLNLAPQVTQTLLDVPGQGSVCAIEITPPTGPSGPVDLRQVQLRIYWDHESSPSVDAPLSLFFATGDQAARVKGLLVGAEPGQKLYCYYPMPFWQRARIVLENQTGASIQATASVTYRTAGEPTYDSRATGYFRCRIREENPVVPGGDYVALSTGGRGHVSGVVLEMAGKDFFNYENFLEGDDRIYVDYRRTPSFHGNGTEDFFNGAYYFLNQTLTRPSHGSPFRHVTATENRRLAYRLFTADVVPFQSHVRIGFEVGGYSHLRAHYRSAVFFYHRPEPALEYTDGFNIGDVNAEGAHAFATQGLRTDTLLGAYEGDLDDVKIRDEGTSLDPGYACSFSVAIPPDHTAVILRRRLDYLNDNASDQTVRVEVGKQNAGTWIDRGHYLNHLPAFPSRPASRGQGLPDKRWLDSDFFIPIGFTRGQSRLDITLFNTGPGPWNAFDFRVYVLRPNPVADRTPPAAPPGLVATGQIHDAIELNWDVAADNTGVDHYEIWRSTSTPQPVSKIGETFGTRFVDPHVDPAIALYYYAIRAVDGAGNVGPFSSPASAAAGRILKYECEELLPATRSPGDLAGQLDLVLFPHLGRSWSGDNQVLFVANQYGDWIAFSVPVTVAGNYELSLAFTSFVGTTSFEVLVDEQPLTPTIHHPFYIQRREVAFKPYYLSPGKHTFKIKLVESPAVYGGTQVVLDCLKLTPK